MLLPDINCRLKLVCPDLLFGEFGTVSTIRTQGHIWPKQFHEKLNVLQQYVFDAIAMIYDVYLR